MGPFKAPTSEPVTLVGCCHCKATKYTVKLPELTSVLRCNCSICSTSSNHWLFSNLDDLTFERTGPLTSYEWNTKKYSFEFCSVCGNQIKAVVKETGAVGLNARTLQDVDLWKLEFKPDWDGASDGPAYHSPVYRGPPFLNDGSEEDQTYKGSCHCGAVTFAMKINPLEKRMVNECNCSFCWRSGRIHCYPNPQDVHIGGAENLTRYELKPGDGAYFCKVCGSHLFVGSDGPVKDCNGKELAEPEKVLGHDLNIGAVNIRYLHGVDLKKIKINKYNGRDNPPEFTVD